MLPLSCPVEGLLKGQLIAQEHHQNRSHKQDCDQQQWKHNMVHQLKDIVGKRNAQQTQKLAQPRPNGLIQEE